MVIMNKPLVSVIIPKTPKENISQSINAIQNSSYKFVEIIVVDEGLERSKQRNIGIERAKGDFILYLDSDQYVSPLLIEECIELMKCGYNAIYIPEKITTLGCFARIRNFERSFYNGTPVDCVRFFRRAGCPMFNVELRGPEDADHDRRINGMRTISKNCLYHYDGIGLRRYIEKKAYYAKSMKRYKNLHPNDKVLNLWYRCFWIFIENGKWKRIIRHPILSLGILFILIIRGFIWLRK